MSVAEHLRIRLDEYDARIRTFIPYYEEMLDVAARCAALARPRDAAPGPLRVVDLGTGTGALAAACAAACPHLALTAIDADAGILEMARSRLRPLGVPATFVHGSFTDVPLPACDVALASLALHHIRDRAAKQRFFDALARALAPGGLLVLVDCYPSRDPALARAEQAAWRAHLRQAYSESEADALFAAWAEEDTYAALLEEVAMLRAAGLAPDVAWRRDIFAVLTGRQKE